jgi:hypothetical protein
MSPTPCSRATVIMARSSVLIIVGTP